MARGTASIVDEGERARERAAADGGPAAFEALMAAYEVPIGRYLRHLVGEPETARDLTQETFLAAYRALPHTAVTNPGGWLYRIATNQALAHLRRRRLIAWLPLVGWSGAGRAGLGAEPGEQVVADAAVAAALARLAPRQRACLLLTMAGFGGEEIAAQLGMSPTAARMCLSRAREGFRRHYFGADAVEG